MPKEILRKQYTGEFKQKAVEDMREGGLSMREISEKYDISKSMVCRWERTYLEEGPEALYINWRRQASVAGGTPKGRKPNLDKKVEEDLIAENQRLRAENDYLKKLNALVIEEERLKKRRR